MKNIFKKNQIIITVLAIMIVIAGYLSFTNNDKPENEDTLETANPDTDESDAFTEADGFEMVQNDTEGTDITNPPDGTDDTIIDDDNDTDDTEDADLADDEEIADDENDETTPVETLDEDDELGDISDDDIIEAANDVTDTGEIDINDDDIPGEAVLVSTTIDPGYFISNKLEREQMRSRNREKYLDVIESPDVAEALKQEAIKKYIDTADIAEKENNTEILLEARGFDDALVCINEGKVDVVINAPSLSDQQVAIIEEIVKKNTQIGVEYMNIVPVVMNE